ncbi:MAG: sigma-E factor negative regulatory protein [Hydrogenophilaceae bacterium]|nr:sigma-E factor negative regulatory protein [Hydrogenophilaceae bacterium]
MQEPIQTSQTDAEDWLSALIDGELGDQATPDQIRRVARDAAMQARWSEYCLIGDAMRGLPHTASRVPARVRAALAEEPTLLAPVARPVRKQPALWLAAAAAVAAVTWMVLNAAPTNDLPVQMAAQPVSQPAPLQMAGVDVTDYLAAHQDYAQALTSTPEMHFSRATLTVPEAAR